MNMMITEEEKKELLSKYSGDTSDELLTHLKRHFPVTEIKYDWMTEPVQFIQVDDKSRLIKNNKKYLVGFIYNLLENNWISLGEKKIRRTIKKYLDGIKQFIIFVKDLKLIGNERYSVFKSKKVFKRFDRLKKSFYL